MLLSNKPRQLLLDIQFVTAFQKNTTSKVANSLRKASNYMSHNNKPAKRCVHTVHTCWKKKLKAASSLFCKRIKSLGTKLQVSSQQTDEQKHAL
jgi:hypothetical protein